MDGRALADYDGRGRTGVTLRGADAVGPHRLARDASHR
jgi:hypothetical protein